MSDALTTALAADEARYRDPAVKSDAVVPAEVGAGGVPVTELPAEPKVAPAEAEAPKPEEKPPEPEKKRESGEQAAIRRLTAKLGDAGKREQDLVARLQALEAAAKPPGEQQPMAQADIERLVQERASKLVAEQQAQREQIEFNAACNRVAAAGEAEYGEDFTNTVGVLWKVIDPAASTTLIEAALETDNPEAVLFHLGKNVAEAERISALKPAKLGAAIAKIANSLAAPPAAPPKPAVSRAPAPVEPVSGGARLDVGALGPKNPADWFKWEAEQRKARG